MAQLDIILILPFVLGLIPLLCLHYAFVLYFTIPCVLSVSKMRYKKQIFYIN